MRPLFVRYSVTDECCGGRAVHVHDQGEQEQCEHEQPAICDLAEQQQGGSSAEQRQQHCATTSELIGELSAEQCGDHGSAAERSDAVAGKSGSELQLLADVNGQEKHHERADAVDERTDAEQVDCPRQFPILLDHAASI